MNRITRSISEITASISASALIISFIINFADFQMSLDETFGEYLALIVFMVVIVMVPIILLILTVFLARTADYIIHKNKRRETTVEISKESKLCIGGYLILDVNFTSWLFAGYFVIHLQSPYYEERSIMVRYNETKKKGLLKGNYKDESVKLRCNLDDNWGSGEYNVTVEINDVCTWLFSLKKKVTCMNSKQCKVVIDD